jgi:hypothetical protein
VLTHEAYQCLSKLEHQQLEQDGREEAEAEEREAAAAVAAPDTIDDADLKLNKAQDLDERRVRWHKTEWEAAEDQEEARPKRDDEVSIEQKTVVNDMLKHYLDVDKSRKYAMAEGAGLPTTKDPLLKKAMPRYVD